MTYKGMSQIKSELQMGETNLTQRLLGLLDNGWIVEVRRGLDIWGRFDGTYILNAKTNRYWKHLRPKAETAQ